MTTSVVEPVWPSLVRHPRFREAAERNAVLILAQKDMQSPILRWVSNDLGRAATLSRVCALHGLRGEVNAGGHVCFHAPIGSPSPRPCRKRRSAISRSPSMRSPAWRRPCWAARKPPRARAPVRAESGPQKGRVFKPSSSSITVGPIGDRYDQQGSARRLRFCRSSVHRPCGDDPDRGRCPATDEFHRLRDISRRSALRCASRHWSLPGRIRQWRVLD